MKHKHHIIPRSCGGTNDPDNIVEVTLEEHAEIHRCLWIYGGRWQDEKAWRGLTGQVPGKELIREILAHCGMVTGRNNKGKPAWNSGMKEKGIYPHKSWNWGMRYAKKPWLDAGMSRTTWYRKGHRCKKS